MEPGTRVTDVMGNRRYPPKPHVALTVRVDIWPDLTISELEERCKILRDSFAELLEAVKIDRTEHSAVSITYHVDEEV